MSTRKLSTIFSKNRTEELPDDIWGKYVLPLNYEEHNLLQFRKSTVVKGGRGSGKTMFLKYHCYPTIFSPKKSDLKINELKDIGLYWRPDTDFSNMITKNYLVENWKAVFEVYFGLSIFSEFSKLLSKFSESSYTNEADKNLIKKMMLSNDLCKLFKMDDESLVTELDKVCQRHRSELNDWLNYPEGKPPIIFGAKEKILYFINTIIKTSEPFQNTCFHIFIDEFENLTEEQQILINSWIKHSQDPLIFHIAYKKYYEVTSDTNSNEKIVDVNDYRIIDLEKIYKDNFDILAAEIILSKIQYFFNEEDQKHEVSHISSFDKRKNLDYQNDIKAKVKRIFPSLSIKETTDTLFKDNALFNKLEKLITDGLKKVHNSPLNAKKFISKEKQDKSIINGILLNRQTINPNDLLEKFEEDNDEFYKKYLNNNLLGAILLIYTSYEQKTCPYYAGFERFTLLSQSNIRHLLELCYQSIVEYEKKENIDTSQINNFSIPTEYQVQAVKLTSKTQINKISSLGQYGKELQKIVIRLGKVFLLSQKRKSQSMAEVNQFTVKGFEIDTSDKESSKLINECKIWGILIEEVNTKRTTEKDNATKLYILHPIFAPYFGISPRKKRKIDLKYQEFKTIFIDKEEAYQELYGKYTKLWDSDNQKGSSIYNTNSLLDFM